jgi:cytidine deaminase
MAEAHQRDALLRAAQKAREHAYAPYSKFKVGAAALTEEGHIFTGVNVENASYGLTICAERSAIFSAVAAGAQRILAIAIFTDSECTPCGACRQVMCEFADDIPIYLSDSTGSVRDTTLRNLLPDHFGPEHLNGDAR